jgi:repressor LexA
MSWGQPFRFGAKMRTPQAPTVDLQRQCLAMISDRLRASGVPPSMQEITDGLGLYSKSRAHQLVSALEQAGRIRRLPNRARAIEIVSQDMAALNPHVIDIERKPLVRPGPEAQFFRVVKEEGYDSWLAPVDRTELTL